MKYNKQPLRQTSTNTVDQQQAARIDQQCNRKKPYRKRSAISAANKSTKRTGYLIVPFKCGHGNHWHLGHYRNKKGKYVPINKTKADRV